ncbi:outer membrane lipoprotein carrier protein LolA [bacterium]|nr:outer membrane lipoprotein carrier protein LolA [bacterium]
MNRTMTFSKSAIGSILPIILILCLAIDLSAGDSDDLLKNIQKSFEGYQNIQADYEVETIVYEAVEPYTEQGRLIWAGDNHFRTETPDQTIVCDGVTLWMYSVTNNQVIIRSVTDGLNDLITPQKLLYEYPTHYDVQNIADDVLMGKSCFLLTLKPVSDTDPTKYLRVWVDKTNYMTRKFMVEDLADNQTIFKLKNFQFDAELSSDIFTYSTPEGVEIIDIR